MAKLTVEYRDNIYLEVYNKKEEKIEKVLGYCISLFIQDSGTIGIKDAIGAGYPNYTFEDFKDNMQEYIDFGRGLSQHVNICIPTENIAKEIQYNQLIAVDGLIERVVDRLNEIGKKVKTINEVRARFTQLKAEPIEIELEF